MTPSTELHDLTVAELAAHLRSRQVSAVEAAQHFLARAQSHAHLGAFLATNDEVTLAQARAADARLAAGTAGALEGVPLAHKDIFVTRDFATTAGSKMLDGYRSPFDATVVSRLGAGVAGGAPGAGMVTLGKLNCDEFAMGSANENSAGTPMRKPLRSASNVRVKSSAGTSSEVASRSGSGPHMAESSKAQSCAVRASGPAWSRLDANATMP